MNMFLVFAGEEYYPGGGWSDLLGSYPTLHEAKEAAAKQRRGWWHIVDLNVMEEVESDF
jgi:hypothetical protein